MFTLMNRLYSIGIEKAKEDKLVELVSAGTGELAPNEFRFDGTTYRGECLSQGWKIGRTDKAGTGGVYLFKLCETLQFGKDRGDGSAPEVPEKIDYETFANLLGSLNDETAHLDDAYRGILAKAINNGISLATGDQVKPKPPSTKGEAARQAAIVAGLRIEFMKAHATDPAQMGLYLAALVGGKEAEFLKAAKA